MNSDRFIYAASEPLVKYMDELPRRLDEVFMKVDISFAMKWQEHRRMVADEMDRTLEGASSDSLRYIGALQKQLKLAHARASGMASYHAGRIPRKNWLHAVPPWEFARDTLLRQAMLAEDLLCVKHSLWEDLRIEYSNQEYCGMEDWQACSDKHHWPVPRLFPPL